MRMLLLYKFFFLFFLGVYDIVDNQRDNCPQWLGEIDCDGHSKGQLTVIEGTIVCNGKW